MTRTLLLPFAAGLAALALAGCSTGQHVNDVASAPPPAAEAAPATVGWAAREEVGKAIELLNRGEVTPAREALAAVLRRQPNDPLAADLLHQIDGDPAALLGKASFLYTARAGDTLSNLAGRFLGNPTQFYALGRYNGLTFPAALHPGQVLRIPGEPRLAKAHTPPPAKARTAVAAARPTAAAPVAVAVAPKASPADAARLRAAALEQLNRGAIDRAIVLLRQADQAAPGNPLVQRDLDRALRIQRAVQSRG